MQISTLQGRLNLNSITGTFSDELFFIFTFGGYKPFKSKRVRSLQASRFMNGNAIKYNVRKYEQIKYNDVNQL